MPTRRPTARAAALLLLATACGSAPTLETRTFELQYLDPGDAAAMVLPYVYEERPDAPGQLSTARGVITVRETSENLDRIARAIAEHDVAPPWVRLHFQIIEADGARRSDTAIAAIETELRRLFRFAGYRLAGEALVTGSAHGNVQQAVGRGNAGYLIDVEIGNVRAAATGDSGLVELAVHLRSNSGGLTARINAREGRTVVLGNAQIRPDGGTVILTVRPELMRN